VRAACLLLMMVLVAGYLFRGRIVPVPDSRLLARPFYHKGCWFSEDEGPGAAMAIPVLLPAPYWNMSVLVIEWTGVTVTARAAGLAVSVILFSVQWTTGQPIFVAVAMLLVRPATGTGAPPSFTRRGTGCSSRLKKTY